MVNPITQVKIELEKLGFHSKNENSMTGRIPSQNTIDSTYIEVEINLKDYPYKQPTIFLQSINGNKNLYKKTPNQWKHLDELVLNDDPKESFFIICCLHNWTANPKFNGEFIYERIVDWLEKNCKNEWEADSEVQGWRMTPHYSNSKIYLSNKIASTLKPKGILEMRVGHHYYNLKSGKEVSGKKDGTEYEFKEIDYEKGYLFFPTVRDDVTLLKLFKMNISKAIYSNFIIIRLPQQYSFTTFYQLLETVRSNFDLTKIEKSRKNIPFVIFYKGFLGELEAVSFITDRNYVKGKKHYNAKPLMVESLPQRPANLDLKIGLYGVGSLGSQIARILTDKQTKELVLYDNQNLSADNLGHHELSGLYLNWPKKNAMEHALNIISLDTKITVAKSSEELCESLDLLVVTVGSSQEYNRLAFDQLKNYSQPILWVWTSPYNVLQEIVITTPTTGCLNCYYSLSEEDDTLKQFNIFKEEELSKLPIYTYDFCGNPHTESQWERHVFLATQVVSVINYYNKNKDFNFDYFAFAWGMNEIIPTPTMGEIKKHCLCNCNRGIK